MRPGSGLSQPTPARASALSILVSRALEWDLVGAEVSLLTPVIVDLAPFHGHVDVLAENPDAARDPLGINPLISFKAGTRRFCGSVFFMLPETSMTTRKS